MSRTKVTTAEQPSSIQPRLLSVKDAADSLRLSERTVYRLIAEGQLEVLKVRGSTRIRPEAVEELIEVAEAASKLPPLPSNLTFTFSGIPSQRPADPDGMLQTATPLAFWWLDSATIYALGLVGIAFIYIGFAVADGRAKVIAVESGVTFAFVVIAAAAITGSAWLLVVGLAGHGLKDLWQHRTNFVAGTRWWPPFCMVVDFVVAAAIAIEIALGMNFH